MERRVAGLQWLEAIGYVHQTVNHSRHYMDPATGVHTNNIEARWSACKAGFKRRYGIARHLLPSYIDEYMWRCNNGQPHAFTAPAGSSSPVSTVTVLILCIEFGILRNPEGVVRVSVDKCWLTFFGLYC